jgi:hypothetical protein
MEAWQIILIIIGSLLLCVAVVLLLAYRRYKSATRLLTSAPKEDLRF